MRFSHVPSVIGGVWTFVGGQSKDDNPVHGMAMSDRFRRCTDKPAGKMLLQGCVVAYQTRQYCGRCSQKSCIVF